MTYWGTEGYSQKLATLIIFGRCDEPFELDTARVSAYERRRQMKSKIRKQIKAIMCLSGLALFFVGAVVYAEMPKGAYMEGRDSKVGVILAHGQGLDPDSQVVGPLRKTINEELGFHTLSLQMPVIPGKPNPEKFQEYASTLPEAYKTIQAGIDFLKKEKGVERIYLMGYSMGGRMTTGFLAQNPVAV